MLGSTGILSAEWITAEPIGILLILFTTVILFGHFFLQAKETPNKFSGWIRRILTALANAILFIGLVVGFSVLLNIGYQAFKDVYGSFTQGGSLSWQSWLAVTRNRTSIVQNELSVRHFMEATTVEEMPPSDPYSPPLFRNVIQWQEVQQNSIASFDGLIEVMIEGEEGYASVDEYYNVYRASVWLKYVVVNNLDVVTEAEFHFPLTFQAFIESIQITVDGEDISSISSVENNGITWILAMAPGQSSTILVQYIARGSDSFIYSIPNKRQISDFNLTISVNTPLIFLVSNPEGIQYSHAIENSNDELHIWRIDDSIMAPSMGLVFRQGALYAPSDDILCIVETAPTAIVFLMSIVTLTLLICGEKIRLSNLALFCASSSAPFFFVMGVNAFYLQFEIVLIVSVVLLTLVPTFLLFRKHSQLSLMLILIWTVCFSGVYPFSGLIRDGAKHDTFNTIIQSVIILYLFGLAFFVRVREKRKSKV
jgi:hypothetical protein